MGLYQLVTACRNTHVTPEVLGRKNAEDSWAKEWAIRIANCGIMGNGQALVLDADAS
jgi:hypothetical protein